MRNITAVDIIDPSVQNFCFKQNLGLEGEEYACSLSHSHVDMTTQFRLGTFWYLQTHFLPQTPGKYERMFALPFLLQVLFIWL